MPDIPPRFSKTKPEVTRLQPRTRRYEMRIGISQQLVAVCLQTFQRQVLFQIEVEEGRDGRDKNQCEDDFASH